MTSTAWCPLSWLPVVSTVQYNERLLLLLLLPPNENGEQLTNSYSLRNPAYLRLPGKSYVPAIALYLH